MAKLSKTLVDTRQHITLYENNEEKIISDISA